MDQTLHLVTEEEMPAFRAQLEKTQDEFARRQKSTSSLSLVGMTDEQRLKFLRLLWERKSVAPVCVGSSGNGPAFNTVEAKKKKFHDYLCGRAIKGNVWGDEFDPIYYEQTVPQGTALECLEEALQEGE